MSADTDWQDYVKNTVGGTHHFRLNETSTAFYDVIGELNIPLTSGITGGQDTCLKNNTTDKSILFGATPVTTLSADMSLTVGGDMTIIFFVKSNSVGYDPTADACFVRFGDDAGSGTTDMMLHIETFFNPATFRVAHWSGAADLTIDEDDINDGEWHMISLTYPHTSTAWRMGVDAATFDTSSNLTWNEGAGPGTTKGIAIGAASDGSKPAGGYLMDELIVVAGTKVSDANLLALYQKAIVLGFPQQGIRDTGRQLGMGMGMGIG